MINVPSLGRQAKDIGNWVAETFGPILKHPFAVSERGLRFLEEAVELAQASGVPEKKAHELIYRAYGKPAGEVRQEAAQSLILLLALANANGFDVGRVANEEWARIEKLGQEHFRDRMRRKIELGFAMEPKTADGSKSSPLPGGDR